MADYANSLLMVRAIRDHTILTGHHVIPGDDPRRAMVGWVCPACGADWHIGEYALRGSPGGLLLGFRNRSLLLSYLNCEIDLLGDNSLLYPDPIEMVRDIRAHVCSSGHRVECSDNPLNQSIGYTCSQCEGGTPRVSTWYTGLLALKSLVGVGEDFDLLRGALSNPRARGRLTSYLNKLDTVSRVSRYKRPWVV